MAFHLNGYSNFHDDNQDWIVSKIKSIEDTEAHTEELAEAAQNSADASQASAEASQLSAEASQTSAENAQQSAENAQQSAEDAQQSAEDAAQTVAATANQVTLLQNRVDNIIPSGTQTEGNTELLDIRVGAFGITYDSAGNAVRGQINDIIEDLLKLGVKEITSENMTFLHGYWTATLTGFTTFENARTSQPIHLNAGDSIILYSRMYNNTQCVLIKTSANGTPIEYIYLGDGNYNKYIYTAAAEGYFVFSYWLTLGFRCLIIPSLETEKEVYIVNQLGAGDYTSFTGMLNALQNNAREKTVYVFPGEYDIFQELGGVSYLETITDPAHTNWADVNPIVPENTHIIGIGNVTLKYYPTAEQIGSQDMAFLFSALNCRGSCTIENIKIVAGNCRYGIHLETTSLPQFNDAVKIFKNVVVDKEKGTYGLNPSIGCGLGANEKMMFENCIIKNDIGVCYTAHDNNSSVNDMATVTFNDCILVKKDGTAASGLVQLITGGGVHYAKENDVFFAGCYLHGNISLAGGDANTKQKFNVTVLKSTLTNGITVDGTYSENPYPGAVYN